jgi:hypothetical protein
VIVFDGDFVDRGAESIEVLCTLLLLKAQYPHRVYLLRGNHEATESLWESVTELFAALPIAARTNTAFIVHGGIPCANFDLDTDLASISYTDRSILKSTTVLPPIEGSNDANISSNAAVSVACCQGLELIQGLIWSDPDVNLHGSYKETKDNPRGCGVVFAPKVAQMFLEKNQLKYLVCGHQAVEQGVEVMNCGHGCSIITVFSTGLYPGGTGTNLGGILHLTDNGNYQIDSFQLKSKTKMNHANEEHHGAIETIQSLIVAHHRELAGSFHGIQDSSGYVTAYDWAQVLGKVLNLEDMPWRALRSTLLPSNAIGD